MGVVKIPDPVLWVLYCTTPVNPPWCTVRVQQRIGHGIETSIVGSDDVESWKYVSVL